MIGFLKGTVLLTEANALILDVHGVGYRVLAPLPVLVSASIGEELSLFIHTHVREDNIALYGFKDGEDLFRQSHQYTYQDAFSLALGLRGLESNQHRNSPFSSHRFWP